MALTRLVAAAAVLLAACATPNLAGDYEAVQPVADGGQRHIRVTLRPDGRGAITGAVSGRLSRFLVQGTWEQDGNRVTLKLEGGQTMVFQHAGELLIAREWDRAIWGEAGPGALTRVR